MLNIFRKTITDDSGNVQSGVDIVVRNADTDALVLLFADKEGTTPIPYPVQTGADGLVQFYCEAQKINVTATKGAFVAVYKDDWVKNSMTSENKTKFPTKAEGVALWDSSISYNQNAITRGSDGNLYQAQQVTLGDDPVADDGLNWHSIKRQWDIKSIAQLVGKSGIRDGEQLSLAAWHADSNVGGGVLVWDSNIPKSNHDGGTIFSPTVPFDTVAAYLNGVGETDPSGAGCWKRTYDRAVNLFWFGAFGDGVSDDTASVLAAFKFTAIEVPVGRFICNAQIVKNSRVEILGFGTDLLENTISASVLIKGASVSGTFIQLAANACTVRSLQIEGQAGNQGDGIASEYARIELSDVSVYGMGRDGIRLGRDTSGANANLFKLTKVRAKWNGRHGLHISQPSGSLWDANAGSVSDADLQYNVECGIYLDYCAFNMFNNLGCQNNGTYGLFATDNAQLNKFFGGDFEVNGRPSGSSATLYYDFYLSDLSEGNRVIGITCYNFPQTLYIGSDNNTTLDINEGAFIGDEQYGGLMLRNVLSDKPTMLDYYFEGSFTPVVFGATDPGVGTYTTQDGTYTRIGNIVNFTAQIVVTAHTGTGAMRISGIPFPAATLTPINIVSGGLQLSQYYFNLAYIIGSTILPKQQRVSVGASVHTTDLVDIPMDSNFTIYISGQYSVA